MKTIKRLLLCAAGLTLVACSGLPERPFVANVPDCPPGHLLVCEDRHEQSALGHDRAISEYRHCGCERLSF